MSSTVPSGLSPAFLALLESISGREPRIQPTDYDFASMMPAITAVVNQFTAPSYATQPGGLPEWYTTIRAVVDMLVTQYTRSSPHSHPGLEQRIRNITVNVQAVPETQIVEESGDPPPEKRARRE